jgi:hypothetical protein
MFLCSKNSKASFHYFKKHFCFRKLNLLSHLIFSFSAPPPSGNAPVIIQTEKKSNTTCIVIITVVCLCVVAPIVVVIAMFATAVSAVSEIASDLTIPETTTAVPCSGPSVCQEMFKFTF